MITESKEKRALRGVVCHVYKKMGRAIHDYKMLADGDKVLVGVSGGFDSLSLLKLFQMRVRRVPIDFELVVCFVDTDFIKVNTAVLFEYLRSTGIQYVVKELALDKSRLNCFWCSWNRRKLLFETARALGCNKVALGHNLDDIIETTLMNLFFNGEISTMKPKVALFGGALTVIRPLCYIEKKEIVDFSSQFDFPDTQYACSIGKDSQRQAMKDIVSALSREHPSVKQNIFRSLGRIRKEYLTKSVPRPGWRHEQSDPEEQL